MSGESPHEVLLLHEDTFYEFFVPYRHPKSKFDIWGGMGLETFGEDFQLVRSLDDNYVWTVVDSSCNSDQWITPGIHHVNRVCYLVTEKPHNGLMVDFLAPHNLRSLTPLGLKRQLRKLEKAMAQLDCN
jgi:hypothetical protein